MNWNSWNENNGLIVVAWINKINTFKKILVELSARYKSQEEEYTSVMLKEMN